MLETCWLFSKHDCCGRMKFYGIVCTCGKLQLAVEMKCLNEKVFNNNFISICLHLRDIFFFSCRNAVSDGFALGNPFKIIKHPFRSIFFHTHFFSRRSMTKIKNWEQHLFKVLKIDSWELKKEAPREFWRFSKLSNSIFKVFQHFLLWFDL